MNNEQLKEAITQAISECDSLRVLSIIYRFVKMVIYWDIHC